MAEEEKPETKAESAPEAAGPTPKKSEAKRAKRAGTAPAAEKAAAKEEKAEGPRAPKRPSLDPDARRLLLARRQLDGKRPRFVRQATYRYYRIGRWESWRAPRGMQSKQRRHYGYRPKIVRVGYRTPRGARGLTPSGFEPVLVRTPADIDRIDAKFQAALIARTVGTRRRLVLEESARQKGVHVLNPIVHETGET